MSDTALVPCATKYVAKKAFFSFLGNTFRIFGTDGSLQFYIKQKAFRLKEEINVFADENQTQKRLTIKAQSIVDFSSGYDITDAATGQAVGMAVRNGVKSMFRDEWSWTDYGSGQSGKVLEVGGILILIRRFIKIIPQKYAVYLGDEQVGTIHQQFNPFQLGYDVDFGSGKIDPRLGVGLVVLLLAIESQRDG